MALEQVLGLFMEDCEKLDSVPFFTHQMACRSRQAIVAKMSVGMIKAAMIKARSALMVPLEPISADTIGIPRD